jgi:hypothetical protein
VKAFGGLQRLFSDKVDGFAPIDDPFVRPDRDETVKDMDLEPKGTRQGELNLPPADAEPYDSVERDIIAEVRDHLNQAHINAGNHIRAYENRLANLELLYGLGSIRAEKTKTLGDIKRLVNDWDDQLSTQRNQIRLSNRELAHFRKKHGLERPYHLVESAWVYWAQILLAWLIETAGNTIFLSENNAMGIIGGVITAAFVSLINVGVAIFAGVFLWRLTRRHELHLKAFAWAGIGLWLLFVLLFNLVAGHFRDAQASGLADPQLAALSLFATRPLGFDSVYSWGMLVIGILAAIFSAYKGFGMDDPFPGYGKLGRRHEKREQIYADLASEAREELAQERDDVIEQTVKIRDEIGVQMRTRGRILAGHQQLVHRFAQHHAQLEGLTNYLLKVYQDANRAARTAPAPAYFDKPLALELPKLAELHVPQINEAAIEKAESELNDAIEQVAKAFDQAIESFTSIEELKLELGDGAA